MTPKTFLSVTLLTSLLLVLAYAVTLHMTVFAPRPLPAWYGQFLLESSAEVGGKVIVESGSNSQHGIDPEILGEYLGAPVLITAIDASYPLQPRIANIARNVREGDVVLLPLEWSIYLQDDVLRTSYLRSLPKMNHYYRALPFREKLRFYLYQYPFGNALADFAAYFGGSAAPGNYLPKYRSFMNRLEAGDRTSFGGFLSERGKRLITWASRDSCDDYLLGKMKDREGLDVSEEVRRALISLSHITERGARVVFTWPAVVDHPSSRCYSDEASRAEFAAFARNIRDAIESAGYEMVGDYSQSHFAADCYLDSYYHLTPECSQVRTQELVAVLESAGIEPINGDTSPSEFLLLAADRLRQIRADYQSQQGAAPGGRN